MAPPLFLASGEDVFVNVADQGPHILAFEHAAHRSLLVEIEDVNRETVVACEDDGTVV